MTVLQLTNSCILTTSLCGLNSMYSRSGGWVTFQVLTTSGLTFSGGNVTIQPSFLVLITSGGKILEVDAWWRKFGNFLQPVSGSRNLEIEVCGQGKHKCPKPSKITQTQLLAGDLNLGLLTHFPGTKARALSPTITGNLSPPPPS